MSLSKRDAILLRKMIEEIDDVEAFVDGMDGGDFAREKLTQKAVVMTLINISELAKNFSEPFLKETEYIPWKDIRALRNLAAHHYDAVDMDDVWLTITRDIPDVKAALLRRQIRACPS